MFENFFDRGKNILKSNKHKIYIFFKRSDVKNRRTSYAAAMTEIVKSVDIGGGGENTSQKSPPPQVFQKPKFDIPVSRPPKPEHPPPQVPKREEWYDSQYALLAL